MENALNRYNHWLKNVKIYDDLNLLKVMSENEIIDSFYKELSFGTGGIRGKMGLGTAKINDYVVSRVTRGIVLYVSKSKINNNKIVIGYDTRNNSKHYAELVAEILSYYKFNVFIFNDSLPTPCVSFAVRKLQAFLGIVITASHNPAEYNGYKVYDRHGCQITENIAKKIYDEIKSLDYFTNETIQINKSYIHKISENVYEDYISSVLKQNVQNVNFKNVSIVYTPLNGTGLKPVMDILHKCGFNNIILVKEQAEPNGNFPTCKKPNPEEKEALELAIQYANETKSDLVLATDPDCDRLSIAIRVGSNFKILSANELGCLLLDYICKYSKLPENPVFYKTIVTTDLAELIAKSYNVKTINTLTGFKYIGEQINKLEFSNKEDCFVFGFEESCGFLKGTYVRVKDATVASLIVCEMYSFYSSNGITLTNKLDELYKKFGYCLNFQLSYKFEGLEGQKSMLNIMDYVRYQLQKIEQFKVILKKDYLKGIEGLPKSDVIKIYLNNNSSIIFRPSGTEPKLKIYFSIFSKDSCSSNDIANNIKKGIERFIDKYL